MPRILNAAVILLSLREPGERVDLRGRDWWQRYFFDPRDGVRAFFERDSGGEVLMHGTVLDWLLIEDLNWDMRTNAQRGPAVELAIRIQEDRGVDFSEYNLVALIVAAPHPPRFHVDGGSSQATSGTGKRHWAVVGRVESAFDFIVHEFAHGLGLDHSCGSNPHFRTTWGHPTEYGHPFCVMSAEAYGGHGADWVPPTPSEQRPEYVTRCPSVNAATASALGWIETYAWAPADGPRTFVLTSLDRARRGVTTPPAVRVETGGAVFVVEYRGPAPWDLGQRTPVVVVNQGAGGRADVLHPGTHSGTHLGHIARGFDPGVHGALVNTGPFAVELVDIAADETSATVRLTPGRVELAPLTLTSDLELVREVPLGEGTTTFAPGERLCVSGTWPYREVGNIQRATFEATWSRASARTRFGWTVAGEALTDDAGEVAIPVGGGPHVAALLERRVAYRVTALPTGSRLVLDNRVEDGTHTVEVGVRMTDPVAAAAAADQVTFTGSELVYPPEFHAAEQRCLDALRDPDDMPSHRIVLPGDLWRRLGTREAEALRVRVAALEGLRTRDDPTFAAARRGLARELGLHASEVRVRRLGRASRPPRLRLHQDGPGPG